MQQAQRDDEITIFFCLGVCWARALNFGVSGIRMPERVFLVGEAQLAGYLLELVVEHRYPVIMRIALLRTLLMSRM